MTTTYTFHEFLRLCSQRKFFGSNKRGLIKLLFASLFMWKFDMANHNNSICEVLSSYAKACFTSKYFISTHAIVSSYIYYNQFIFIITYIHTLMYFNACYSFKRCHQARFHACVHVFASAVFVSIANFPRIVET